MATFIAGRIETARDISLEAGQDKYRAYFINTTLYLKYKSDVDAILLQDGYGDCIVSQ
ncbi:Hypothetical protein DPCES_5345 [Desulfitobacterium hafniense]|uniref:Uncharacterized protein n=1 Tax=Desulfitobacterium hafniense TaxID=49338 RepID=A0A098AUV1_DESHA|nr:hypothetical protein [Desulfitobacterium hafniense]CDV96343.1 Hypothetical protein DPCES_5345 [Desulfitobacterium hafniense]